MISTTTIAALGSLVFVAAITKDAHKSRGATSMFRGHPIVYREGRWYFLNTNDPVATSWQTHPCGHCNSMDTQEGHDGCLGRLPGVMNACCGHGEPKLAYIQFTKRLILRGYIAHYFSLILKRCQKLDRRHQ